jgi:hypothetical protein
MRFLSANPPLREVMRVPLLYIERVFISFIYLAVNMQRESIGKEVAAAAGSPKAVLRISRRLAYRRKPFERHRSTIRDEAIDSCQRFCDGIVTALGFSITARCSFQLSKGVLKRCGLIRSAAPSVVHGITQVA